MIGLFVTMQVKPGFSDQFREASIDDSEGSVRDEPGCYRFDTLQSDSDPNCFYMYMVFADRAALDAHHDSPHWAKWNSAVKDCFEGDLQVVRMTTVFPSDDGWKAQQPHLLKW